MITALLSELCVENGIVVGFFTAVIAGLAAACVKLYMDRKSGPP